MTNAAAPSSAHFKRAGALTTFMALAFSSLVACEKTPAPRETWQPAPTRRAATSPAQTAAPLAPDKAAALNRALGLEEAPFGATGSGASVADTAPDPKDTVAGTINLPAAHRALVARGDVMFLAARRAGAPPGPGSMLAVQKLVVEDFPMPFVLSARDAMIPGTPFEGRLSLTIRVDKDGDALTRNKGDLYGEIADVVVGTQNVKLSLDHVQAEDRTIASPQAVRDAMMPPGHP